MAHTYILGSSGTGKSTHLKALIHTALDAGEGVLFLDPHGEDATDLLSLIPKHRHKQTLLFDPSDFALAWNPLDAPQSFRPLIATAFTDTIRSVSNMPDAATANMDMTVHSCVAALMEYGGTLLDITTLLSDRDYRAAVKDTIRDDAGKEHWAWFESLDKRQQGDITRSTYNKFYQLKADPRMRQVFGHQETRLNVFDVVHKSHVLIARLPQGKLGSAKTKLVGNLLLSLTQVAAMSRPTETPFRIFVDEAHLWAPDILKELLTGIRKFNVSLIVAHQFASQVTPELFDALRGNAESHVFRVSPDDARRFQTWFPPNAIAENIEDFPDFTYRKFPWRKGDRDVTISPLDVARHDPTYIEETMRRNYMRG